MSFAECEYSSESVVLYDYLNQFISLHQDRNELILLTCGNASIPSARRCAPGTYDNGLLSFDRSFHTGIGLMEKIDAPEVTWTSYANGTHLNEQSVRIYLISKSGIDLGK